MVRNEEEGTKVKVKDEKFRVKLVLVETKEQQKLRNTLVKSGEFLIASWQYFNPKSVHVLCCSLDSWNQNPKTFKLNSKTYPFELSHTTI